MQIKPKRQEQRSKRWDVLLLFTVVIAIFALIILFYSKKEKDVDPEYPKTIMKIDDISVIDVNLNGKKAYSLTNKENKYYLNGDKALNADKSELICRLTSNIEVEGHVDQSNLSLSETGLDAPHIVLDIHRIGSETIHLFIGNKIPLADNYYFKLNSDNEIYEINNGYEDIFNIDPLLLLDSDSLGIARNLIKSINIQNPNGEFEIILQDSKNKRVTGYINKPIHYPADSDKVNAIINSLINIDLALPIADSNDLDQYGFDSINATKINVELYTSDNQDSNTDNVEIVLGNSNDEFYVFALYNNRVYKISSIAVQSIMGCNIDTLLSKKIFNLSTQDLDSLMNIKDSFGDKVHLYSIMHENDGELAIYNNDEPFDKDAFVDNIKTMLSLELDGFEKSVDTKNLKLIRQIEFAKKNETHTVSFYEKDEYNLWVSIDGVCIGYCIKQNLNQILFPER